MRGIDAHLRDPADAERRQRLGELARKREIGREVIVDEEEQLLLVFEARDLRHDGIDRTMAGSALKESLHGAEVAREAAAAAGLDQSKAQIAAATKQRAVVAHLAKIRLAVGLIDRLEPPRPRVLDHVRPELFGLADHDRLGVVLDLI